MADQAASETDLSAESLESLVPEGEYSARLTADFTDVLCDARQQSTAKLRGGFYG